jgi:hypothetical protein
MINLPTKDNPKIKYVKKARQWVKTYFVEGKMIQEWSDEKPES